MAKITSGGTWWGVTGSPETLLDRSAGGTLWWFQNEADDFYPWYSTDEGNTWSYAGDASHIDYLSSRFVRCALIDSDGYLHTVGRIGNTTLKYGRGTPGSTGKTWSHKTYDFTPSTEALSPPMGMDLIAFRLGSGWKAFVLVGTTRLVNNIPNQTLRLVRFSISSAGAISLDGSTVIRTATGYGYPYGSLAFQHTGDGKTATATPHVYVVSSVTTEDDQTAQHRQDDLQLHKLTYEAGNWTLGAPVVLEAAVDTTGRTMRAGYDGARVVVAYGTRNRTTGVASAAIHVAEWLEATGAVTRRDPAAYGGGYPLGTSLAIDPVTDDIYIAAYGETNGVPRWSTYNRLANTWSAWANVTTLDIGESSSTPGGHPGRISLKRYVAKSAIECVYLAGSGGNYQAYHARLASTNSPPSPPALLTPAPSSTQDIGQGAVFSWRFTDPDPGDTQGAWQMRRKLGAAAYSYYNAATQTWQAAAVWNVGAAKSVSFPPGVFTNGVWSWSVNTQDAAGLISGFAPDVLVTASTAPVAAVTSPLGIYALDSSPIVTWDYVGARPQRTYQLRLFDLAAYSAPGFDPAASVPLWDSGDTSSVQARSTRTGATLRNGGTYRAYLRVSDSTALYSAWTYGEFLLALTPAPAPQVEAMVERSHETGLLRVRLVLQGLTNMLSASQSYDHADLTQWLNDANAAIGSSPNGAVAQTQRSLTMTSLAAGEMRVITANGTAPLDTTGAPAQPARDFPAAAGQVYTALASFTAAAAPRNVRVSLRWYRPDNSLHSSVDGVYQAALTGFPTQVIVSGVAPLGVDRVRLVLGVLGATAAGEEFQVDGIDLHPGKSTDYSPGGLVATQTLTVNRYLPGETVGTPIRDAAAAAADEHQHLIVRDREMPFGTEVSYTAQAATVLSSGQVLASDPSPAALAQVNSDTWALRDPADDTAEVRCIVTGHRTNTSELATVYRPAGRDFPLVETEGVQGEDGTLTITAVDHPEMVRIRALSRRPTELVLQSPAGDLNYIRVYGRAREAGSGQSHTLTFDYVEVAAP